MRQQQSDSWLTCRFSTTFPLELESRLTPKIFAAFIESLNEPLVEAYSVSGAVVDNLIAVATWWTSLFWRTSHFEKVSDVGGRGASDVEGDGDRRGCCGSAPDGLSRKEGLTSQELRNAERIIKEANENTFNPVGLNVLSPRSVALQYVSKRAACNTGIC